MTTPAIAVDPTKNYTVGNGPQSPSPPLSEEVPSKFLPGTIVQWAWDGTSLGTAMDCPRKYFYSQILGLRRKRTNANISFGQAFHKAIETYELAKGEGSDQAHAVEAALAAGAKEAVNMGEHRTKTPESLARSISAYIAHHEAEQLETLTTVEGNPAVELHFVTPLGYAAEVGDVTYCGYLDRVVNFQGVPYILDTKTTGASISTEKGSAAYFGAFTPDNQFTGYTWAARAAFGFPVRGVILDAMQIAKTKTEFARNIIHRTTAQIDEWQKSALDHIDTTAKRAARAQGFTAIPDQAAQFPMNTRACHARYGACTFASICGRDPAVRHNFLETDFERVDWNPLAPRQSGTLDVSEDAAPEE